MVRRCRRLSCVFLFWVLMFSIMYPIDAKAEPAVKTYEYVINGESSSMSRWFTLPDVYKVNDITVDQGTVTTEVDQDNDRLQIRVSGGSYHDSYQPSSSCSTTIGPQTSSSFPSSTSCTSNGITGTVSASGSPSSSTQTLRRTETDSCSNSSTVTYTEPYGHASNSGSGYSCPSSISYNSGGYSGTLSRTSTDSSRANCPTQSTPGTSCTNTWVAYYSGEVTKTETYYTQSYSGTVYGSRIYYYRYRGTVTYETNLDPVVELLYANVNQTVSDNEGFNVITIKGKVHDPDGDSSVTLSSNIGGVTRSFTVDNPPTQSPSESNFTLEWILPTNNVPEGNYNNVTVNAIDTRTAKASAPYTGLIRVDKTPAGISNVRIVSNNPNITLARPTNQVSVTFTTSESLRLLPEVKINGVMANTVRTSGNNYSATRIMNTSDVEGFITLEIDNVFDVVNNKSNKVTSTSDSSRVRYDKTPPVMDPVTVTSNSSVHPYVKEGDRVTINFTPNEELLVTPTLKVQGYNVPVSRQGSGYTASYVIKETDEDGSLDFQITATDLAGNVSVTTKITDGEEVIIYRLPPKLENVTIRTSNPSGLYSKVGDTVTLDFDFDKPVKQTPRVLLGGRDAKVVSTGKMSYRATRVLDSADTEGQVSVFITDILDIIGKKAEDGLGTTDKTRVIFDKTPPALNKVSISSNSEVTGLAEPGDVVVLDFVSSEDLSRVPTVTMEGKSVAVVKKDARRYEASYVIAPDDEEGLIDFVIGNLVDLAGNTGATYNRTTDGTRVSNSYHGPKVVETIIYSSNPDRSKAVEGDTVTVELEVDRPIGNNTKVRIGTEPAYVEKINSVRIKASRKMKGTEPEGEISFEIFDIQDQSGNTSPKAISTTDGSKVVFEVSKPFLTSVSITSSNANPLYAKEGDILTLSFTSSTQLRQSPVVILGSGFAARSPESSGNSYVYTYEVTNEDSQGKAGIQISNIYSPTGVLGDIITDTTDGSYVIIDTVDPIVSNVNITGGNREGQQVTLTFTSSETLKKVPTVAIGGKDASVSLVSANSYRAVQTLDSTMVGSGTLSYHISGIEDLAGNLGMSVTNLTGGSNHGVIDGGNLIITLSGVIDGGTYTNVAIPVYSASSSASTSVEVTATLNGSSHRSGTPVRSQGNHRLIIAARDDAGNTKVLEVEFTITSN